MKGQIYLKNVATLRLDIDKCIGCGFCVTVCPHRVFEIHDKKSHIMDKDLCMECGACAINCPVDAISVQSGVGCASGILQGFINGGEPTCDCGGTSKNKTCC